MTLRGPKIHPSMGRNSSPCFMCLRGSEVSVWLWDSVGAGGRQVGWEGLGVEAAE